MIAFAIGLLILSFLTFMVYVYPEIKEEEKK